MTKATTEAQTQTSPIEAKNGLKQPIPLPPETILSKFMEAWTRLDWRAMTDYCQLSWVDAMPDPVAALKGLFQFKPLKVEIKDVQEFDGIVYVAKMEIKALVARGITQERTVEARLICENGPLEPSRDGYWGVNPLSLYNTVMTK